jgi:hypothetical protein
VDQIAGIVFAAIGPAKRHAAPGQLREAALQMCVDALCPTRHGWPGGTASRAAISRRRSDLRQSAASLTSEIPPEKSRKRLVRLKKILCLHAMLDRS